MTGGKGWDFSSYPTKRTEGWSWLPEKVFLDGDKEMDFDHRNQNVNKYLSEKLVVGGKTHYARERGGKTHTGGFERRETSQLGKKELLYFLRKKRGGGSTG